MPRFTALRYVHVLDPETSERVVIPKGTVIDTDDLEDGADERVLAILQNPKAFGTDEETYGDNPSDDPLMKRTRDDLLKGADEWTASIDVTGKPTKAELVEAIRQAGYTGDGSDLLDADGT